MVTTRMQILIAEDNNDHYISFVLAINAISTLIDVMRVDNGYDLFSMLQTNIKPDIIFLDIDMPYKNGLQILEEMQEYKSFSTIPVVVLSSSAYDVVIKTAYKLGAIFFIKKYAGPNELKALLQRVLGAPNLVTCKQPAWEDFLVD